MSRLDPSYHEQMANQAGRDAIKVRAELKKVRKERNDLRKRVKALEGEIQHLRDLLDAAAMGA